MSRHNRRRVRGHKAPRNFFQRDNFELPTLPKPSLPAPDSLAAPLQGDPQRGDLTARHWHNRYIAWQNRDRRQREEQQKLMADRRRIFGGCDTDDADEEGLCAKMMQYFSGLDYIEE